MTANRDIYIVLTGTGTAFSGLIKWFTKAELNHASIAFDSELREVYSFGRKKVYNPFIAGLIHEDFVHPFYSSADCAIYQLRVTTEEYDTMYNHVQGMMQNQERYKYHLLGLVGVLLNIRIDRENAFFCSQFVASVFEETAVHPVAKPSCFVTPEDFASSLCAHKIFSGKLSYYMHRTNRMAHLNSSLHNTPSSVPAEYAARRMRLNEERAEGIV
ncbi:hypothetical protein HQN87_27495 [Paenibacillus tritici]|uniref:Uncharacterized protein n=1 Tax=Paenibacillus tritici TaxID=1873425 RepID=A0ABX2DXG9_9BACL|nr:hypothetical protein [Paenibacillus tritici]NQX49075.1 hypothetical protein [Paenibacillus tritici]QUL56108.1 hypothetical protein KDC22_06135 [Paenibacillus tritici]